MTRSKVGRVVQRIPHKKAYEAAWLPVEPLVRLCADVQATTPPLTRLMQTLTDADQTRQRAVTAGEYGAARPCSAPRRR